MGKILKKWTKMDKNEEIKSQKNWQKIENKKRTNELKKKSKKILDKRVKNKGKGA